MQFFHYVFLFFPPDGLTLFTGGLACHITENRSLCSVCALSAFVPLFSRSVCTPILALLEEQKKRAFKFKFEHVSH